MNASITTLHPAESSVSHHRIQAHWAYIYPPIETQAERNERQRDDDARFSAQVASRLAVLDGDGDAADTQAEEVSRKRRNIAALRSAGKDVQGVAQLIHDRKVNDDTFTGAETVAKLDYALRDQELWEQLAASRLDISHDDPVQDGPFDITFLGSDNAVLGSFNHSFAVDSTDIIAQQIELLRRYLDAQD